MNITWTSQRGLQRSNNSDAAAVAYAQNYLIAVVVDAAELVCAGRLIAGVNEQGVRLASYWADTCVTAILANHAYSCERTLVDVLRQQQKALKHNYLHDIASYGVLILDTTSREFNWWFTGDCRLGIETDAGELSWQGVPHRVENAPLLKNKYQSQSQVVHPDERLAARHTLTQSLKARRFTPPEPLHAGMSCNDIIHIATDGYWSEHLADGTPMALLDDDASLLSIKFGEYGLSQTTDTPNFLSLIESEPQLQGMV